MQKFFFSIFTAVATGGVIALFGLFAFNYIDMTKSAEPIAEASSMATVTAPTLEEEDEEDPSFVSRFSRVLIYSADDGREIIESAKNSLPKTGNVDVSALSYVVFDLSRHAVAIEKDADRLLPIASITKLVTAVIAQKLIDQNKQITVTRKALATYGNEGRLREGEKMRAGELLYPLLMVSSNDAAEILAQYYGREKFIKEMNAWVNSIGAYRTYFKDPSGLSEYNVSTARDLSTITNWILENDPEIFNITLVKSKTIRTHTWINPTHFLNLTSYAGGKNGYTPQANRTSVSLFKLGKQKRPYAVVMLGSSARDNDTLDLLDEAIK